MRIAGGRVTLVSPQTLSLSKLSVSLKWPKAIHVETDKKFGSFHWRIAGTVLLSRAGTECLGHEDNAMAAPNYNS